ncbi:MAG TPA: excinuclease ABC subunit UvrC [Thermodesulfovibrionales bacterium]|nr:excinuclease ABC subunit UvrC [Thermodesulfovibrionales bacterium]
MLEEKLSHTPKNPGVYLFKGQKEKVIYVGKAKNLRNRLKTYFQRPEGLDQRKAHMVTLIKDFSYIVTENELEALVLEANLIKQYKPRFNVILRDDKNYPYLKLTMGEEWPRLEVIRRIAKDGSRYFGPYVPSQTMWDALSFIRRNFPIRICRYSLDKPMRPCIQYQMGRCIAPCSGKITRDEYMKIVNEVSLFLSGERKELLRDLEEKMAMLSAELKYEEAARIRDRINNIRHVWESQRVVAPELGDIDVIGFYSDGTDALFDVFFVRKGILVGTRDFYITDGGNLPIGEILHGFIEMFYMKEIIPPGEIVAGSRPDDLKNLTAWLRNMKGGRVEIGVPKRGKKLELLKMADENAAQVLRSRKVSGWNELLGEIKERLHLPRQPQGIGAFDVSTISGSESVGAFICWSGGDFVKDLYRRLKIKGVSGIDDYAMMDELVTRVLSNLGENVPDLIVIDGGRGQLDIAQRVVETRKITGGDGNPPMLVAVAKDPDRAITVSSEVIDLEDRSQPSLVLKKIRDEVHRFAITYHRKLRDKRMSESPLERVKGIGKKRRLELLRYFDSIESIRNATIEEIARIKGFNRKIAETLLRGLRRL